MSEMNKNNKINAVVVQRGDFFFGQSKVDKDGNITAEKPQQWIPDPEGCSVIVTAYDTETHAQIGTASLFAWWDSHGVDCYVRETLGLKRRNFPTPEELYHWIKRWEDGGFELCEFCEGPCAGYDCHICPVGEIKMDA